MRHDTFCNLILVRTSQKNVIVRNITIQKNPRFLGFRSPTARRPDFDIDGTFSFEGFHPRHRRGVHVAVVHLGFRSDLKKRWLNVKG